MVSIRVFTLVTVKERITCIEAQPCIDILKHNSRIFYINLGAIMTIDRNVHVNLSEKNVTDFLKSNNASYSQELDDSYLTLKKLVYVSDRPSPINTSNTGVDAFLLRVRNYDLYRMDYTSSGLKRVFIGNVSSTIIVKFKLTIRYKITLLVSTLASVEQIELIKKGFAEYDPSLHGEIEAYIQEKSSAHGIPQKLIELIVRYELLKEGYPTFDLTQDDEVRRLYGQEEKYELREGSEDWLKAPTEPSPVENVVVVKPGESGTTELENRLDKRSENLRCGEINRIVERVSQVFWYPQFKTENECQWLGNDCWKTRVCLDVPYIRDTNVVLYATVLYSVDQEGLRDIIQHCLIQAASAAVVIGLVTENLAAALAAFQALFVALLKDHAITNFECMLPELYLIEEVSDWRRVV